MKHHTMQSHTDMSTPATLCIITLSLLAAGSLIRYGPVPQDPAYHLFADQKSLFSIPNFWNVVSNLPFVLVGLAGLHRYTIKTSCPAPAGSTMAYRLFFGGVVCIGLSSGYYHVHPDNWSLFWDRLSMALSFMAFLSIVIGAFASRRLGRRLLPPLVLFGLFSVVYWMVTEQYGTGDLRPYIITQFLPVLVIPVIIFSRPARSIKTADILVIGAGYVLAKLFEALDGQIFHLLMISGHTLKHLAAAFCAYWMLHVLRIRKPLQERTLNSSYA